MYGRILLVEDDLGHQLLVKSALNSHFMIDAVRGKTEALALLSEQRYDLFLLDVMLEDGDGYGICSEIRRRPEFNGVPVIFLSSRDDVENKVMGLSLGADDYIVKPCNAQELLARVQSRIERYRSLSDGANHFIYGTLNFDLQHHRVRLVDDTKIVDLTPLEFGLALFLAKGEGQPFTRQEIIKNVWGDGTNVSARSVDTYVASLRRKLGDYHGKQIRSVHGVGYLFKALSSSALAS